MSVQPTLRAEIAKIINEPEYKTTYEKGATGVNSVKTTFGSLKTDKVDAILQLISSRLKEKKFHTAQSTNHLVNDALKHLIGIEDGYNQAIKDFKAILESKE